jgi:hypothetical protein
MAINCKIIKCDKTKGRESVTMMFPHRTGQVLTLAVEPAELAELAEGATYQLGFELVAAPAPKSEPSVEKEKLKKG